MLRVVFFIKDNMIISIVRSVFLLGRENEILLTSHKPLLHVSWKLQRKIAYEKKETKEAQQLPMQEKASFSCLDNINIKIIVIFMRGFLAYNINKSYAEEIVNCLCS